MSIISNGSPQYGSSPCPTIFIYQYDQQRGLYGEVQIANSYSKTLQLSIELSVGNAVQGYNGNIELSKPKEEVFQDILNYRPILYKVFFPVWREIPPRITKIMVNGNLICSGPRIPMNLVPIITTINLQHLLKIDVLPLSSSSSPRENNIFNPDDGLNARGYGYNFRPFPGRPSTSDQGSRNTFFEYKPKSSVGEENLYPHNPFFGFERPSEEDDSDGIPEVKPSATEEPLRKNLFFDFNPGRPRPKINRKNPFLGTPSEHEYRPGGIFKELGMFVEHYDWN
ncbi:hypothetical protein JTB14_008319 [Gonioctena quinquepunctata]|nr:hypothetical protein JTB14_008319 [Gonioctena quinquepunctata]